MAFPRRGDSWLLTSSVESIVVVFRLMCGVMAVVGALPRGVDRKVPV